MSQLYTLESTTEGTKSTKYYSFGMEYNALFEMWPSYGMLINPVVKEGRLVLDYAKSLPCSGRYWQEFLETQRKGYP